MTCGICETEDDDNALVVCIKHYNDDNGDDNDGDDNVGDNNGNDSDGDNGGEDNDDNGNDGKSSSPYFRPSVGPNPAGG